MAEFKLNGATPLKVQLLVGGAFPYDWDLYNYSPDPQVKAKWIRSYLGGGSGPTWFELPAEPFGGHALTWSVAVVNFDSQPMTVDVVANMQCTNGLLLSQKSPWTVSKESPYLFVNVEVTA